jgi:type VI protein secretion system component VasK
VEQNINQPSQQLKHKMPKNSWRHKNRKVIKVVAIVLAVALILTAGGYLGYRYYKNRQNSASKKTVDVCGSKYQGNLLQEAGDNLQPQSVEKLKPYVDKILGLNNYEKDPNCLYVVTLYYINISDSDQADRYNKLLQPLYDGQNKFNSYIQQPILSKDELNSVINNLNKVKYILRQNNSVRGE